MKAEGEGRGGEKLNDQLRIKDCDRLLNALGCGVAGIDAALTVVAAKNARVEALESQNVDLLEALKKAESFIRIALSHSLSPHLFDSKAKYLAAIEEHIITLKVVVVAIAKGEGK